MFKKVFSATHVIIMLSLVFAIWMLFLDDFTVSHQMKLKDKITELEQKKEFYLNEIRKDSILIHTLSSNMDSLEKYGRENYLMKKENEDIFLVIE